MDIRRGTVKSFDAGTYKATIDVQGSHVQWLADVPTNRGIAAGDMTAGRTVVVIFFEPGDPADAQILSVF